MVRGFPDPAEEMQQPAPSEATATGKAGSEPELSFPLILRQFREESKKKWSVVGGQWSVENKRKKQPG
jgi:hypothetical protein